MFHLCTYENDFLWSSQLFRPNLIFYERQSKIADLPMENPLLNSTLSWRDPLRLFKFKIISASGFLNRREAKVSKFAQIWTALQYKLCLVRIIYDIVFLIIGRGYCWNSLKNVLSASINLIWGLFESGVLIVEYFRFQPPVDHYEWGLPIGNE